MGQAIWSATQRAWKISLTDDNEPGSEGNRARHLKVVVNSTIFDNLLHRVSSIHLGVEDLLVTFWDIRLDQEDCSKAGE